MPAVVGEHEWGNFAQAWELGWWTKQFSDGLRSRKNHLEESVVVCTTLDITQERVEGRVVLDAGCGPTGRLNYLVTNLNCKCLIGLDSLWSYYKRMYQCIDCYYRTCSRQIEHFTTDFVHHCDVVISINALDHCYDLPRCLHNLYWYLKDGGIALFSFDCFEEEHNDMTHPIRISHKEADRLIREAGFRVHSCDSGSVLAGKLCWGGGTHYHW